MGALTEPVAFDADAKLIRIASKDGHPHQVQAIKLLRDRERCPVCAARAESVVGFDTLWQAMTDDERERFRVLSNEHKQIRTAVQARIAQQGPQ